MKSENKLAGLGLLTAISASLCCITPVLALLAGTSGLSPLQVLFHLQRIGQTTFVHLWKMVSIRKTSNVYFFTATNLNWIKLLEDDAHKNIVINSFPPLPVLLKKTWRCLFSPLQVLFHLQRIGQTTFVHLWNGFYQKNFQCSALVGVPYISEVAFSPLQVLFHLQRIGKTIFVNLWKMVSIQRTSNVYFLTAVNVN